MKFRRSGPLRVALTLAAGLALAGCDSAEDRLARHLANAEEHLAAGAPEKATLELRNALSLDANNVKAHMGMATIYEGQRNFPAMLAHLNKVLESDPTNVDALVKVGQMMMLGNRLDEALTNANEALAAAPQDVAAMVLKAGVSLRLGNFANAVELAQAAIALDPDNPTAHAVLIGERLQAGDAAGARAIADDITTRAPEDLGVALVKLQIVEQEGDEEALIAYMREMVSRFPDQVVLRRGLAQLHIRRDEFDLAEAELRAIAEAAPDDPQPALAVVQFLNSVSGIDAARAELASLVESRADKAPFEIALAELDYAVGAKDEAKARLESMIEREAANADVANSIRLILARQFLRDEKREDALALVQTVLEADAANVDALAIRSALRYDAGEYDAALLDARAALASAPDNAQLLLLSGRTNMRAGNADLAGENFASAMRASGYAPEVTMEYVSYLRLRQRSDAILTVLAEAVARHPSDETLLTELAAAQLRAGDWVGAEETSNRLASVDKDTAQRVRAASLTGRERFDESLALLGELAEGGEGQDSTLASIIQVYARAGRIDEARTFLNDVLTENPANARALLLRGFLSASEDDLEAAEADYRAAVAADPTDPAAALTLARVLMSKGDEAAAIAAAEEAIATVSSTGMLRLFIGGIHEGARRFDEAIAQYRAMFEEQPTSLVAANNLASLLTEHKSDDPEAIAEAARISVVLRNIEVPAFQDTFGWVQHLNGDSELALRHLIPAADGLPDNPYVRYHIGAVYAALGDAAAARPHLEAAVATGPEGFSRYEAARGVLEGLPPAQ
ncbi:MAG: tetratricopeptide repeat protein [Pikeienuella sp.]|uniref:tetratricopeptide repeat protein n=1 Tax=Pikeienuella sp. TaxID=2831957 RepID=UPI003919A224